MENQEIELVRELIDKKKFKHAERFHSLIIEFSTICFTMIAFQTTYSTGKWSTDSSARRLQAYAIVRKTPRAEENPMVYFEIVLEPVGTDGIAKDEGMSRILCSTKWLQLALQRACLERNEGEIYRISRCFLEIVENVVSCPQEEIVTFAVELMNAMKDFSNQDYQTWKLMFYLVVVHLIVNAGGSALTQFQPLNILKSASSMIMNQHISSWMYMNYIRHCFKNPKLSIVFIETKAESVLKRIYSTDDHVSAVDSILQEVSNVTPFEIYLDPVYLLVDLLESTLSDGQLVEAKRIIEKIESYNYSHRNPELELQIIFAKEKWIAFSGPPGSKPFSNMAKVIAKMVQLGLEHLALESSTQYWNLIMRTFKSEISPELIPSLELMIRNLDQITKNEASKLKSILQGEISRYNGEFITDIVGGGDVGVNDRVANLLSIASSLEIVEALILYLEAFKILDPTSGIPICYTRFEERVVKKSSQDNVPKFRAIAKSVHEILTTSKVPVGIETAQYWDLVYVSCLRIDDPDYLNPNERFEIFGIQLDCLFCRVRPQLIPEQVPKFNHLAISTISLSLSIAKELRKRWMVSNCVIRFWKLYCIANGMLFPEIWTDIISDLFQYYSTEDLNHSEEFVLVACMYINNQLDHHFSLQSKVATGPKPTNSKETSTNHQKNAEDAFRACFRIDKHVDLSLLLHLLPAWNRLQLSKTGNTSVTGSFDFEDPILRSLLYAESVALPRSDTGKTTSGLDNAEDPYSGLQAIQGLPTIVRIRMYQKSAKQSLQDSDPVYTVGILKKILYLSKEFKTQYLGLSDYVNEWCWLTQLDALKLYFELIEGNSNLQQEESILECMDLFRDMATSSVNLGFIFQVLLRIYGNYQERFFDSSLSLNAACIGYNFFMSAFKLYPLNQEIKAVLDGLNGSDLELVRDLLRGLLKYFRDKGDHKKAKKLLDTALRVVTPDLRAPLLGISGLSSHKDKDVCLKTYIEAISQATSSEERIIAIDKCKDLIDEPQIPAKMNLLYHISCVLYGFPTRTPPNVLEKALMGTSEDSPADKEELSWFKLVVALDKSNTSPPGHPFEKSVSELVTDRIEKFISIYNKIMETKAANQKQVKGKKDAPMITHDTNSQIQLPIECDTFIFPRGFTDALRNDSDAKLALQPIAPHLECLLRLLRDYFTTVTDKGEILQTLILGELLCDLKVSKSMQIYHLHFLLCHAKTLALKSPESPIAQEYYMLSLEKCSFSTDITESIQEGTISLILETCQNLIYFANFGAASSLLSNALIYTQDSSLRSEILLRLTYLCLQCDDQIGAKHYLANASSCGPTELCLKMKILELFVNLHLVNNSSGAACLVRNMLDWAEDPKLVSIPTLKPLKCNLLWILQYLDEARTNELILHTFEAMEGTSEWVETAQAYAGFLFAELSSRMCLGLPLTLDYLTRHQGSLPKESITHLLLCRTIWHLKSLLTRGEPAEDELDALGKYLRETDPIQKSMAPTVMSHDTTDTIHREFLEMDIASLAPNMNFCYSTLNVLSDCSEFNLERYFESLHIVTSGPVSRTTGLLILYSIEATLYSIQQMTKEQVLLSLYLQEVKSYKHFEENELDDFAFPAKAKVISLMHHALRSLFSSDLDFRMPSYGKQFQFPTFPKDFEPRMVFVPLI
jgi:hypothetical protein